MLPFRTRRPRLLGAPTLQLREARAGTLPALHRYRDSRLLRWLRGIRILLLRALRNELVAFECAHDIRFFT